VFQSTVKDIKKNEEKLAIPEEMLFSAKRKYQNIKEPKERALWLNTAVSIIQGLGIEPRFSPRLKFSIY
jgi:hypothetical protein